MRATGFRLLGRGHAAEHCGREGMLHVPVAMRFELRLHKHQHKHTNWPRPRRRAPHHARGIARLPCDECLGPRDRRFSHTDRAAGVCEAAVGSRRVRESRRRVDAPQQSRGGSRGSAVGCISLPSRTAGPPDLRTLRRRRTARHRGPRPPGARVKAKTRPRVVRRYSGGPRAAGSSKTCLSTTKNRMK